MKSFNSDGLTEAGVSVVWAGRYFPLHGTSSGAAETRLRQLSKVITSGLSRAHKEIQRLNFFSENPRTSVSKQQLPAQAEFAMHTMIPVRERPMRFDALRNTSQSARVVDKTPSRRLEWRREKSANKSSPKA